MSVQEVDLKVRMLALKDNLAALYPSRRVTRNLVDEEDRTPEELKAGIYTIVSKGERDYKNWNGGEATEGKQGILLVGQFMVEEGSTGEDIEDQEFIMVAEVKAFLRALPPELCCLQAKGFQQSMQTGHPYGFVAFDLEIME